MVKNSLRGVGCWRVGAEGLGAYRAFGLGLNVGVYSSGCIAAWALIEIAAFRYGVQGGPFGPVGPMLCSDVQDVLRALPAALGCE